MIYPIPQINELTGKQISVKSVSLSGEFKEIAEKVFEDYSIPCNNGLSVVFKYENSKETTYSEEIARLTDEKYIIIVSQNQVVVKASCEKGAFRGAHTLAKLISNGDTVFTATLYNSSNVELDSVTIKMTSKAGFFQKIGGFFRGLFGMTKIYAE